MRLLHPSLGLTALVAAFAVGLRTEEASRKNTASDPQPRITSSPHSTSSLRPSRTPSRQLQKTIPLNDPQLEELTHTLSLSHSQQAEIHPAIIRSSFHYDPEKQYLSAHHQSPRFLGPPITSSDFEDALFSILDADQQLDYAAAITEKDAWWDSVISRLEADLDSETSPSTHLPQPAPEPEPATAPSQNGDRQLIPPPPTN